MQMHFHASLRVLEEEYGNAILTHRPSQLIKAGPLPGGTGRLAPEPRGALWASINLGGMDVQVITTHLGLRRYERLAQVDCLLGPQWLGHGACREPVILLGDFNASPRSRAYQRLASHLRDVQKDVPHQHARPTFPSRLPMLRIDHAFVSRSIHVIRVESVRTPTARAASDHLPLMVEFQVMPVRGHKAGAEQTHDQNRHG
jgi:endonuclease/exonuclease/phosphatase family metal-dependent hydrolase